MNLQVDKALKADAHFFNLQDSKWVLAIFQPVRWGFAGTGLIAEDFIEALSLVPGAELVTCAARNKSRLPQAQEFAKKHGQSAPLVLQCDKLRFLQRSMLTCHTPNMQHVPTRFWLLQVQEFLQKHDQSIPFQYAVFDLAFASGLSLLKGSMICLCRLLCMELCT